MTKYVLLLLVACGNSNETIPDATGDAPVGTPDASPLIGPTTTSVIAATATATHNALCTAITPFYWEIGDATAMLANGSLGVDSMNRPIVASTRFSIASASKWLYGTYIGQLRGGALTSDDINFLHFTSGYTNMGSDASGAKCPSTDVPDTVNTCLALVNTANNEPYSYQDPTMIGRFAYDGGHLENHASLFGGLGDIGTGMLGPMIGAKLGTGLTFVYSQPLLAGGVVTTANDYASVLRGILEGSLVDTLGIDPVCTQGSASCNAARSPMPEAWHYSMAHWVEDDPATHGDGAFSSAGAFGFYPWIEAGKNYYGVVSREAATGGAGYASAQCGRLIRRAWDTGLEQTGTIPN